MASARAVTLLLAVAAASSSLLHPRSKLPYSLLTAPHARARHRRMIDSWRDIRAAAASDPTIRPTDYGADPTGRVDSTPAFTSALAALLSSNVSGHTLAFGVADLGGATLDLSGGDYLITSPLIIPPGYGNFRFIDGTLRAGPGFPAPRYLIEVGGACTNSQGSCNENVGFEGLMLDAGQVGAGGLKITATMGANIGPQMFLLNFTTAGILLDGGHEAMVHETWLGEFLYSDPRKENGTASVATGIQINGNDHYVTNTIVFSSHIGVTIAGAADVLTGVHTWNLATSNGGTGILVTGSQNRLEEVYLDYNMLEIVDPTLVTVVNSFFLCCAQIVLSSSKPGIIGGLYIAGNEWYTFDNKPVLAISNGSDFKGAQDVNIFGNVVAPGATVPNVRVTRSVTSSAPTTSFSIDFSDALLLPSVPIKTVTYSVTWDAGMFAMSSARTPKAGVVVVETSAPVSGTVVITVDQGDTTY